MAASRFAAGVTTFLKEDRWLRRPSGQRDVVQHRIRQQPLELVVLALKLPQPPGLGYLQPAILGLPVVDRRFRHPVPPGQISGLRTRLCFLQHANDLLF